MNTMEFCEKYLQNYNINSDGTIDVNGYVFLMYKLGNMKKLPVKFGKVSGDFSCYRNSLTTLEGCPKFVGGDFDCRKNNLMTLEGCSKYIGGYFACGKLTHHILGNVQGNIFCNKQRIVI